MNCDRTLTFHFHGKAVEAIEKLAAEKHIYETEVMRRALLLYLAAHRLKAEGADILVRDSDGCDETLSFQ